ncbi:MAG: hypothetical protein KBH27_05200 [Prevotella sp.]|jgi:hypothetical protein|nr:hypothetical protein [Prevotella sp.]
MDNFFEYKSLDDIRRRKETLRNEIQEDDKKIKNLWEEMSRPSDLFSKSASPSKRITGLMSTGAALFDGAMLGWKLYRKFRK